MAEINWAIGLTPNFSDAIRYQEAGQANRQRQAEQQREQAQQAALSAYAQNPETGLAGVLATDPRTGIALQANRRQEEAAQRTAQQLEQERAFKAKISLAQALVHTPRGEDRSRIYQGLAPILPGVDEATLAQLAPHIDDDNFLRGLIGKYDEELKIVAPGGAAINPQGKVVYQAPAREPQAPAGYRTTPEGGLQYIPGGPADPRQAGTLAGARRKPGGGSGGGKRSVQEMSVDELKAIAGVK